MFLCIHSIQLLSELEEVQKGFSFFLLMLLLNEALLLSRPESALCFFLSFLGVSVDPSCVSAAELHT